MAYLAILSISLGLYFFYKTLLWDFVYFLPALILFGVGLHIIIDRLIRHYDNKNAVFLTARGHFTNSLCGIKVNNSKKLILSSNLSKTEYYIIPVLATAFGFILGFLFLHYHRETGVFFWMMAGISLLCLGIFYSIIIMKQFWTLGDSVIFEKDNNVVMLKLAMQQTNHIIPFTTIENIIVETVYEKKKEMSSFLKPYYQTVLQLTNGEKVLIDKADSPHHIQIITRKIKTLLNVNIIDQANIGLSFKKLIATSTLNSQPTGWKHLVYQNHGDSETFAWKRNDSFSLFLFEIFFMLITTLSLFYVVKTMEIDRAIQFAIVLFGVILIQLILFIKNHFGVDYFTFNSEDILYQHKLFGQSIKVKKMNCSEVRKALFLFDEAILEGKKSTLVSNISRLNIQEKNWLKRKWMELLKLPDQMAMENKIARFG